MAAAQGNYHSTPNGGQTALMGNIGVALGHDGSAPFLNPATIVDIHDFKLAFSMNAYAFSVTRLINYHQPGAVDRTAFPGLTADDTTATDNAFDVVPSTLCFFFTLAGRSQEIAEAESTPAEPTRRGRQKLAMCLGNTERRALSLPALNFRATSPGGLTQQAGSLAHKWLRWHVGPSYAAYLTSNLALGLSLHGVYTYYGFHGDNSAVTTGGPAGAVTSSFGASGAGHSIDLDAIVGLTYRLGRSTVGLSLQAPSLHVTGAYDANLNAGGGATGQTTIATGSGDLRAPSPVRVSAGVGIDVRKDLKVEMDASYYFPLGDALRSSMHVDQVVVNGTTATPTSLDAIYAVRARPALNVALGGEYFLTPAFSVLGGLSTDFSATPELDPSTSLGNFYKERVHRVSLSGGVGSYGDAGDFIVGTQVHYGWGEALAWNPYVVPNAYSVIDIRQFGVMLVLAGSTNFRAITRAVERATDIVKGKPEEPK